MNVPKLEPWCGSWVVICKQTGKGVLETYSADVVSRINQKRYEIKTAHQYLVTLNKQIKEDEAA